MKNKLIDLKNSEKISIKNNEIDKNFKIKKICFNNYGFNISNIKNFYNEKKILFGIGLLLISYIGLTQGINIYNNITIKNENILNKSIGLNNEKTSINLLSEIEQLKKIDKIKILGSDENILNNKENQKIISFKGFEILKNKIKEKNGINYIKKDNGDINVIMSKDLNNKYLNYKDFGVDKTKIFYFNNYLDFYFKSLPENIDNIDFMLNILKYSTVEGINKDGMKILKLNYENYSDIEKEYYKESIDFMIKNSKGFLIK